MFDVRVTEQDFDVGQEYAKVRDASPQSGAIVFFVGLVRDFYSQQQMDSQEVLSCANTAEQIEYLELQHYAGMTETLCMQIIEQAKQRWALQSACIVHRVGKLKGAEQIVMVSVASAHRKNAFEAAQFMMDFLKTKATFWKKEVGTQGQNWVEQKQSDLAAAHHWLPDNQEKLKHDKQ